MAVGPWVLKAIRQTMFASCYGIKWLSLLGTLVSRNYFSDCVDCIV